MNSILSEQTDWYNDTHTTNIDMRIANVSYLATFSDDIEEEEERG